MPLIYEISRALAVLTLALLAAPSGAQLLHDTPAARRPASTALLPESTSSRGRSPAFPPAISSPLRKRIGKASVVGLGESIHTSGGYYQMKHRVFRYLVERGGFRVLAIESPWSTPPSGPRGSSRAATARPTWPPAASSTSGRARRRATSCSGCATGTARIPKAKDRVHFLGFDIQDFQAHVHFAGTDLLAFLGRLDILVPDPGPPACSSAPGRRLRAGRQSGPRFDTSGLPGVAGRRGSALLRSR